jgi:DNA-binding MarR family transcriptional regulator
MVLLSRNEMCTCVYMAAKYPGVVRPGMKPRVTRGQAPSRPAATSPVRLSPKDEHIFRDLMERFAVLSEMCFRFSQDIYLRTGSVPELEVEETIVRNVSIARRVFGNRFLEILATIYLKKAVGANELATILGDFSKSEMVRKLRVLEMAGLVERGHSLDDPDSARYSLTHKGTVIARLGEPVFLYLRLAEGWTTAPAKDQAVAAAEGADQTGEYEAAPRT